MSAENPSQIKNPVPHSVRAFCAMSGSPAVILLAAAIATIPILLHGPFCGDDFEFHAVSWFDVHQTWLHGHLYPHWLSAANYGAGEPRFMFYPPLTWVAGAALGFLLPWQLVPIALVFLTLAATGLAVRKLAREVLPNAPATLAGCTAIFSGFTLFTAYERTAFAELTGGFFVPLILLYALRDRNPAGPLIRRTLDGSTVPLALLIAGVWLSNGPAAVMATYLLAAVAFAVAIPARSFAPILRATVATLLGLALPAFFLLPAAWEQRWADLRAAVDYPVFQIQNNWLFANHTDPLLAPHESVLHRASMIAATMLAVTFLCMLLVSRRGSAQQDCPCHPERKGPQTSFRLGVVRRRIWGCSPNSSGATTPSSLRRKSIHPTALFPRRWWIPLALLPFAVLFLQLPISLPLWNLLPKARFLQYPWRWLLVLEAPLAIFFAAAVWPKPSSRRWRNVAIPALCTLAFLAVTAFSAKTFLRTCDQDDTIPVLHALYQSPNGLEGTDEYEPAGSDHWQVPTGLPDACLSTDSDTVLGVTNPGDNIPNWNRGQATCDSTPAAQLRQPEHLRIATITPHAGFLILRLLSYPAWRVEVNAHIAGALPARDDGLIAVPVPQGQVTVTADWTSTPDVITGRCISAIALLFLFALALIERNLRDPQASGPPVS